MKRKKAMEYTKKLTPRELALAELKTRERRPDRPITLTDFINNCLIPRLDAKKRRVIVSNGKVTDVCELADNMRQLRALSTVAWMMGMFPPKTHMPAELKDIEFIFDDEKKAAT
jgi:hypothetical protein